MLRETAGLLGDGIPDVAIGDGPPLVKVVGLAPHPRCLRGGSVGCSGRPRPRLGQTSGCTGSTGNSAGNRMRPCRTSPGTWPQPSTTTSVPVFLTGTSTGGSIALRLVADRLDLVRGLVMIAAAYRPGPRCCQVQQELARSIRAGDFADGWAQVVTFRAAADPAARPGRPWSGW